MHLKFIKYAMINFVNYTSWPHVTCLNHSLKSSMLSQRCCLLCTTTIFWYFTLAFQAPSTIVTFWRLTSLSYSDMLHYCHSLRTCTQICPCEKWVVPVLINSGQTQQIVSVSKSHRWWSLCVIMQDMSVVVRIPPIVCWWCYNSGNKVMNAYRSVKMEGLHKLKNI